MKSATLLCAVVAVAYLAGCGNSDAGKDKWRQPKTRLAASDADAKSAAAKPAETKAPESPPRVPLPTPPPEVTAPPPTPPPVPEAPKPPPPEVKPPEVKPPEVKPPDTKPVVVETAVPGDPATEHRPGGKSIPEWLKLLESKDEGAVKEALAALEMVGAAAKPALPAIEKLQSSANKEIAEQAKRIVEALQAPK